MQLFLLSFLSFHKIAISFKIFFHCFNVILTDECIQISRWLLVARLTNFCDLLHLLLCLDSFRVYTRRYCRTMSIFAYRDKISYDNYSFLYSLNIFDEMMIDRYATYYWNYGTADYILLKRILSTAPWSKQYIIYQKIQNKYNFTR